MFRELLWITEGREQKHEQMDEEAELFTDQSLLFDCKTTKSVSR